MRQQKTWFITGVSSGIGKALIDAVIRKGDYPIGSLRTHEQVAAFNTQYEGRAYAYKLDVCDADEVKSVACAILKKYPKLDIIVNNAGYGLMAAIEETSQAEARAQMETNFFGALAVTQAFLAHFRNQQKGHIIQISSVAGLCGAPGLGLYNASKHALEGLSEALALELAPFNIKVTLIEPGPFRTLWAGASAKTAAQPIAAYDNTPARQTIHNIQGYSGNQDGDPVKAAALIARIVDCEQPPLRLPLGEIAISRIRQKLTTVAEDINTWEEASLKTHF